jgi:hypothetical protein
MTYSPRTRPPRHALPRPLDDVSSGFAWPREWQCGSARARSPLLDGNVRAAVGAHDPRSIVDHGTADVPEGSNAELIGRHARGDRCRD